MPNSLATMAVMAGAGAALQSFDFGCLICSTRAAMALGCIGQIKERHGLHVVEFLAGRPEAILTEFFDRVFSRKITNISNTHPGKHIFIDPHMWGMTESTVYGIASRFTQQTHEA